MALQNLKEQYEDLRVFRASYSKVAEKQLDEIRETGPHCWGHAGEMETSNDLPQQDGTHPESERRARVAVSARGRETEAGIRRSDVWHGGKGRAHAGCGRRQPCRSGARHPKRQILSDIGPSDYPLSKSRRAHAFEHAIIFIGSIVLCQPLETVGAGHRFKTEQLPPYWGIQLAGGLQPHGKPGPVDADTARRHGLSLHQHCKLA